MNSVVLALLVWFLPMAWVSYSSYGGDPRGLLLLGSKFPAPSELESIPNSGLYGYDGQFYAAIATDPDLSEQETVEALDSPEYRAGRILVPVMAWIVAAGHSGLAVWTYILTTWILSLIGVAVASYWILRLGAPAWWAWLLPVGAGCVISVLRVTPDLPALTLALGALGAGRCGRQRLALFLGTLAPLARETMILYPLAMGLVDCRDGKWKRGIVFTAVPMLVLVSSRVLIHQRFDTLDGAFSRNFGLPFAWVGAKVGQLSSVPSWKIVVFELCGLSIIGAACIACILLLPGWRGWTTVHLSYALTVSLVMITGFAVWEDTYAYARVFLGLPIMATILACRRHGLTKRTLLAVPALAAVCGLLVILRDV
jgi:hypothetical protein